MCAFNRHAHAPHGGGGGERERERKKEKKKKKKLAVRQWPKACRVAPIRVNNLIAVGFIDATATLSGKPSSTARHWPTTWRRAPRWCQLRATLPIGRVVGPADIAALAVHLMINTAVTGATYDIDGGQQLVPGS